MNGAEPPYLKCRSFTDFAVSYTLETLVLGQSVE